MKPDDFEDLLPAYMDGDLTAEQRSRIEAWLDSSEEARRSLDAYRRLDSMLALRCEQVPPPDRMLHAVFRGSLLGRVRVTMDSLFNFPMISSALLILVGIGAYLFRDPITTWFSRTPRVPGADSRQLQWVQTAIQYFTGADVWTLTAIYVGITIAILFSTTLMLMRFLRD